jgi:hypothetical protein
MKKGCLITLGIAVTLFIAAIVAIYVLAAQYERRPKLPGEAETNAAEDFIREYKDKEASGNSADAIAFATEFARDLRVSRQILFSEGKAGAISLSKGRFLTYCFLKDDSLTILVHVPELRRYTDDAKLTLEEYAWTLATTFASAKHPEVKRLALGIKGVLDYSSVVTGVINKAQPLKGIEVRHPVLSSRPLWPFFAPVNNVPAKAEQSTGALPVSTDDP